MTSDERAQRRAEVMDRLRRQRSPVRGIPATAAQLNFIARLLETRVLSQQIVDHVRADLPSMTMERAKDWIEVLKPLPRQKNRMV